MLPAINAFKKRYPLVYSLFFLGAIVALLLCTASCKTPSPPQPVPQPSPQPTPTPPPSPQPSPSPTPVPAPDDRATLYLILAADTNDPSIGRSVRVDRIEMQKLFETIEEMSQNQLFVIEKVIEGDDFSRQRIVQAIEAIRPGPDDVIVFSYSGHGFRESATETRWPELDTPDGPISFKTVLQMIQSKGARQFIALADCCNQSIDVGVRLRTVTRIGFENIKRLFLDSKTSVAASGSKPGQFSFGNDRYGGFFTAAFIKNVNKALQSGLGWEEIMARSRLDVIEKARMIDREQEPQYWVSDR